MDKYYRRKLAIFFAFKLTNNEAEFEALFSEIKLAKSLEVKRLEAYSDSQLVVKLSSGENEQKEERLKVYDEAVRKLASEFK